MMKERHEKTKKKKRRKIFCVKTCVRETVEGRDMSKEKVEYYFNDLIDYC